MGKGLVVEIVLERTDGVFAPLDIVRGHVLVDLTSPQKVKDIKLRFRGQANVKWLEEEGTGIGITRMNNSRFFRGQEQFFDTAVTLVSRDSEHKEITMEPKTHTYPFAFRLREQLPTSFESSHGHIRYWLYVSVGIPKALSKKRRKPITVLNRVDLNNFEEISCGRTDEIEKSLGCVCFHSEPLHVLVRMNKMGFVPGEALHIDAEINNRSNLAIRYTKCTLTQIIRYHSNLNGRNATKVASIPVATVTQDTGLSGQDIKWKEERLRIPPIPPTSYKECAIIEIHYRLFFVIKPSRFKSKIRLSLPVVIGTIPIEGLFYTYKTPPARPAETGLLSRAAAASFLTPLSSIGIPAPSYFESVFGKVQLQASESDSGSDDEGEEKSEFAPFYTFYGSND